MNTLIRTITMSVLVLGVTACSEQEEAQAVNADIEVSISTNPHWGTLTFDIQAIADSTVISNVIVNVGEQTSVKISDAVFLYLFSSTFTYESFEE